MEIALITCLFCCIFISGQAQEKGIPEVVKASLSNNYPKASKVKWDKEENNFEASFSECKNEISVVFDAAGNILESEKEIPFSALPESVKKTLKGKKVSEAAIITKNGKTYYEAEVNHKDLIFDEKGQAVKL